MHTSTRTLEHTHSRSHNQLHTGYRLRLSLDKQRFQASSRLLEYANFCLDEERRKRCKGKPKT